MICPGPFDFPLVDQEPIRTKENTEALEFLDKALEKYGPKSVVYVGALLCITSDTVLPYIICAIRCLSVPFGGLPSPKRFGQR